MKALVQDANKEISLDLKGIQLKNTRKKALSMVAIFVFIAAVGVAIWYLFFDHSVSTDNAYVGAETATINSMIAGQVNQVFVSDTEHVKKGQLLVQIDAKDAMLAVNQAKAELLQTKRQFQQSQANSHALESQVNISHDEVQSAMAQVNKAQADLTKSRDELGRRMQLQGIGAISKEELSTAKNYVNTAKAALDVAEANLSQAKGQHSAAQSNLAANEALIENTDETSHPNIMIAEARLQQALINLERTKIVAPIDGIVVRRNIQVGQLVSPGITLMIVVPEQKLYVDANFKESQLKHVRPGQHVILTSDLYGDDVKYRGIVVGSSGGTGSAFALIPAQNATGNWIKVVQRLPVRIQLDSKQLSEHPLRVGLSMHAKIDLDSR